MLLIRIILFFLFLYLLVYLAGKIFALWLRSKSRKYSNTVYSNRKEGEVTVENSKNSRRKKIEKDEGEYVSFKEVEDK